MARVGLKNFKYSELDENDKVIKPQSLGRAVDCKVSLNLNNVELHADDTVVESDYSFNNGTVTITIDDDDDKVLAPLLGHEISKEGEVIRKDTDQAPFIAFGRIITKIVNNVYKYKVEFLNKVKFKDFIPDEETKKESLDFKTVSIEGAIYKLPDGSWSKTQTFDTFEAANTYLDSILTKAA